MRQEIAKLDFKIQELETRIDNIEESIKDLRKEIIAINKLLDYVYNKLLGG